MKIIKFNTFIVCEKTSDVHKVCFNLNTEKLIAKIKKTFKERMKINDASRYDYLFEIKYEKNGEDITEQFDSIFKLIYRIKTI